MLQAEAEARLETTVEQLMEHGTEDIDSRLRAVRKDDDGTIVESHALWNRGKRVDQTNVLRPAGNLHRWRIHYTPQGRRDSLFDRIKRKLGLG